MLINIKKINNENIKSIKTSQNIVNFLSYASFNKNLLTFQHCY